MSINIYLIKHLDVGTVYVGITGDELGKRWYQHLHDPKDALYKPLRAVGHGMSMELLEEVATREEALIKEQEYIHALGTAHPNGWNRDVRPLKVEELKPGAKSKEWERHTDVLELVTAYSHHSTMECPSCKYDFTHQEYYEIFQRNEDCDGIHTVVKLDGTTVDTKMKDNPSSRRDGMRMYFSCESCHGNQEEGINPPLFELLIYQHKGVTIFETVYYEEKQQ
jgi:predicted GIY-YIG superfamily endonuclease